MENSEDYESVEFIRLAEQWQLDNQSKLSNKKRNREKLELHLDKPKNKNEVMREHLLQTLDTPIDKKNKGFKMLLKMGFQEGSVLGKNQNGLKEPINIKSVLKSKKSIIPTNTEFKIDCNYSKRNRAIEITCFKIENLLLNCNTLINLIHSREDNLDNIDLNLLSNSILMFFTLLNKIHITEFLKNGINNLKDLMYKLVETLELVDKKHISEIMITNKTNEHQIPDSILNINVELTKISENYFNFCLKCSSYLSEESEYLHNCDEE